MRLVTDYIIEPTVKLGSNVTIQPYAVVKGNSVIMDNAVIGSFSYIEDSVVGVGTVVKSSRICNSKVGNNCTVGPCAHLRDNANIGNNCRIGNYVEVKNSTIGTNTKASHLAYIGDATVGNNCNIGCGVVFVNYDGKTKHHTTVGNNCFVGCNSNLVAPLVIGNNCFVACGTNVNGNMPDGAFGIGRSYLTVKEGKGYEYTKKE